MLTTLRRRKSRMYDVRRPAAGPPLVAVVQSSVLAYSGAQFVAEGQAWVGPGDVGITGERYLPPATWLAGEDPVETVDSVVIHWQGASTWAIQAFQPGGAPIYSAPAGFRLSTPGSWDGSLYWVEVEGDGGLSFALRRARPDLSEITTVDSVTVSDPSGGGDLRWRTILAPIAVGPDAVLCEWQWALGSFTGASQGTVRVRFPLGGGGATFLDRPEPALSWAGVAVGAPEGGYLSADGTQVLHTGGSTAVDLAWAEDYYAPGSTPRAVSAERLSVAPDGTVGIWGAHNGGHAIVVVPAAGPAALFILADPPAEPGFDPPEILHAYLQGAIGA